VLYGAASTLLQKLKVSVSKSNLPHPNQVKQKRQPEIRTVLIFFCSARRAGILFALAQKESKMR
jgi:hypothetical protein